MVTVGEGKESLTQTSFVLRLNVERQRDYGRVGVEWVSMLQRDSNE